MAYDVQRFNELTKQMSAYAHYARGGHLQLAAARARRARQVAEQVNSQLQLRFRAAGAGLAGRLRLASELLDSDYPAHRAAGRKLYAQAKRTERLAERDERLRADQHPGEADGRYRAACSYAERWGLEIPPGRWTGGEPRAALHTRTACSSVASATSTLTSSYSSSSPSVSRTSAAWSSRLARAWDWPAKPSRTRCATCRGPPASKRICETAVGPARSER
jgi:hypothetical protein